MTTHTASSPTQSPTGRNQARSNRSPTHSWDSGVYVHMELSFDESEETNNHKENKQRPKVNPQAEVQKNKGELAEKDQDVNYIIMSDLVRSDHPDLVICTAGGLKGSTSAAIPEVHNRKALMPPSMLAFPLPLPPKRHQRSPAFEKTLSQCPQLKTFSKETKPLNSLACQTSPVLSGVKGNNQCLDLVPGEVPDMHNSYANVILPKVEPKCPPQRPPRPPPIKPPRSKNSKRAEIDEGKQRRKQEAEWRKQTGNIEDERNREEQHLIERNEKTQEYEETSGTESHLDVGKPLRHMLAVFTDKEKGGEEGEDRGKEDEDPSNTGLTTPTMTENSSLLAIKCSDLIPDEKPGMAATNRNCTSTASSKPERMVPPQPPPKPHRKCPPKPPIKPPQLFSAMRAAAEEEKERRKQEGEQWRDEDLVDKEGDESEGEGQDRGKVNGDPRDASKLEETVMKSTVTQDVELPRSGKRFCLKPPCRKRPTPVITAENQSLHCESQHPGKQHQNKATEQVQPGPLSRTLPARFNPIGTDSNMETLKWTGNNKEIQIPGQRGQDSEVISKLPSGLWEGTEVVGAQLDPCQLHRLEDAHEIAETLLDGEAKQTTQKSNARGKVKQLAQKVVGRLKEGREEKRRIKVEEIEMDGLKEDDVELTQDEGRHGENGGTEEEEGIDEDAVDRSAVTETQSHADLVERRIKQRHATSESPFGSFRVCSPVKLVEELLSGDEWSQFLCSDQSSTPDPPPHQTHSGDTAQLSGNFQLDSSADLDLALDVFEGSAAVPQEEPVYEDIDLSDIITEEGEQQKMNRAPIAAVPKTLLECKTSLMSHRTKDIYDTVEFIQPANTCVNLSDIKSEGVLDSSVQKYLIKLSKKRKHRAAWIQRRGRSHGETLGQSPSSTSPQQVFSASVFYNVPASGGEEEQQHSTGKSGGSSPKGLAKIKMVLKDKTLLRAAQPKEDRGK